MNILRNHWYHFGILFFATLSFFMLFGGSKACSEIQIILCASLMALPIHQYEEYAFPGGGPLGINRAVYGEKTLYRHYPGNWNSIMIVNLSAYIFYLLATVFPEALWLGIATMLFNLIQLLEHGIVINLKLKTWYTPGQATSVFLLAPISVYYFYFICSTSRVSASDWLYGMLMLIFMVICTVILPVQTLKKKDSPYEIPQQQIEQFEKVCRFASIHKENKKA